VGVRLLAHQRLGDAAEHHDDHKTVRSEHSRPPFQWATLHRLAQAYFHARGVRDFLIETADPARQDG
jgi:hypothetical protein